MATFAWDLAPGVGSEFTGVKDCDVNGVFGTPGDSSFLASGAGAVWDSAIYASLVFWFSSINVRPFTRTLYSIALFASAALRNRTLAIP